jgi:hypothetical protein
MQILGNLGSTNSSHKLSFGAASSDGGLELGLESNDAAGEGEDTPGDRATSLEVGSMSGIKVSNESKEIVDWECW